MNGEALWPNTETLAYSDSHLKSLRGTVQV